MSYQATVTYTPARDAAAPASVSVAGEFSAWQPRTLTYTPETAAWTAHVALDSSDRAYMYKFIVDGDWVLAPDGRKVVVDAEGMANHVLRASKVEDEENEATRTPSTDKDTPEAVTELESKPDDTATVVDKPSSPIESVSEDHASEEPVGAEESLATSSNDAKTSSENTVAASESSVDSLSSSVEIVSSNETSPKPAQSTLAGEPESKIREVYHMLSPNEDTDPVKQREILNLEDDEPTPTGVISRIKNVDFLAYFLHFYQVVILGIFGFTVQAFHSVFGR